MVTGGGGGWLWERERDRREEAPGGEMGEIGEREGQ